jgi:hypothetical protein
MEYPCARISEYPGPGVNYFYENVGFNENKEMTGKIKKLKYFFA